MHLPFLNIFAFDANVLHNLKSLLCYEYRQTNFIFINIWNRFVRGIQFTKVKLLIVHTKYIQKKIKMKNLP